MPITHVIDRFRQGMVTIAEGLVTFADIMAHLDVEAREHGLDLPELIDARFATTDITPNQVRQIVRRVHDLVRQQPFGPTAIVATDDVAFGMARMFSILAEGDGVAVGVFRDIQSASSWLKDISQRVGK
jgi:hypothetical protein